MKKRRVGRHKRKEKEKMWGKESGREGERISEWEGKKG